jgi:hypothetical protein
LCVDYPGLGLRKLLDFRNIYIQIFFKDTYNVEERKMVIIEIWKNTTKLGQGEGWGRL